MLKEVFRLVPKFSFAVFKAFMDISMAAKRILEVCKPTPLQYHRLLSEKYGANIYLKREDLQPVRSYKIRGAYNKIRSLDPGSLAHGVVCASAGNHAQGVAYSCHQLRIHGDIFMPLNTPLQKIEKVKFFGKDHIKIFLQGETYDDCCNAALSYNVGAKRNFIHPFDDMKIIEGQGTVGKEITDVLSQVDFLLLPVGGGGLAAGTGSWMREHSPHTIIIGVEPEGAPSMTRAMEAGMPVELEKIDPFVDGAAVKKVGQLNFDICRNVLDHMHVVPEGKVCSVLLHLYNDEGMVVEPAGALTLAALDDFGGLITGKNVVCVVSGGNNDVLRIEEIRKLADVYEGLHHHLIMRFKHSPDGLAFLFTHLLGDSNYVTRLQYDRREHGRTTYGMVGIKSASKEAYAAFLARLEQNEIEFREVKKEDFLFKYLI